MNEFDVLSASAAGMDAERSALDLAARNVAAASATQDGAGFIRLVPRFAIAPDAPEEGSVVFEPPDDPAPAGEPEPPVRYLGPAAERGDGVDAIAEMVSVLSAQRAYEANASIFDLGKRLAERTIDLGRVQ